MYEALVAGRQNLVLQQQLHWKLLYSTIYSQRPWHILSSGIKCIIHSYPLNHAEVILPVELISGSIACEKLQKHNTETVYISLLSDFACVHVLCKNSQLNVFTTLKNGSHKIQMGIIICHKIK